MGICCAVLLALALAIVSPGLSNFRTTVRNPLGAPTSFQGLRHLYAGSIDTVKLLVVHGMGDHVPGHSSSLTDGLAARLGLRLEHPESPDKDEALDGRVVAEPGPHADPVQPAGGRPEHAVHGSPARRGRCGMGRRGRVHRHAGRVPPVGGLRDRVDGHKWRRLRHHLHGPPPGPRRYRLLHEYAGSEIGAVRPDDRASPGSASPRRVANVPQGRGPAVPSLARALRGVIGADAGESARLPGAASPQRWTSHPPAHSVLANAGSVP